MLSSIPQWNHQGIVNPVNPQDPTSPDRSPYVVSLVDFVRHFATSPERKAILGGLLRYRAAIHQAGLTTGFQWLDGSFLENKEALRGQPPGDIDVVIYFHLLPGETQAQVVARDPFIFGSDRVAIKHQYHVDAYFTSLQSAAERLVLQSIYWYGMWSHQRDTFQWKGFLQVDLSSTEDNAANALLQTIQGGGTP